MNDEAPLNTLTGIRGDLKLQGRVRDMIPIQWKIIALTEKEHDRRSCANAWNYLSALYHKIRSYPDAEMAAINALSIYAAVDPQSDEVIGCYKFMLARIIAAQQRFAEAIPFAESAVKHYSIFHDPPDDFLRMIEGDLALMREFNERDSRRAD